MQQINTKRVVVLLIEGPDGRLLFGKRKKDAKPFPNMWNSIGGKIEEGESLIEAAKREALEECGLDITDLQAVDVDEIETEDKQGILTRFVYVTFLSRAKSLNAKPGGDINEVSWFKKSDLSKVNLNPPTIRTLKRIGNIK